LVNKEFLTRWVAKVLANNIGWLGPGDYNTEYWLAAEKIVEANLMWAIGVPTTSITEQDISCAFEASISNLPRPPFGFWI
jgi:hypothetical protein